MATLTRAELDRQMLAIREYREGKSIHEIAHEMRLAPKVVDLWLTNWRIIRRCADCTIILTEDEREFCGVCARRRAGESWACGTELDAHDAEPVKLMEVLGHA